MLPKYSFLELFVAIIALFPEVRSWSFFNISTPCSVQHQKPVYNFDIDSAYKAEMAPHADDTTAELLSEAAPAPAPQNGHGGKNGLNGAVSEEFSYPPYVPENSGPYQILKQYHSKPTKLRVACIGAGASGLCLAYKMEKMLVPGSFELTLYDKNPAFGGTWYENTYPGVACDVSILCA